MHRHLAIAIMMLSTRSVSAEDHSARLGERLIEYYQAPHHYRAVKRDVLRWHKTTRNGCVAFASTALRHIGFAIPEKGKRDGWGVSRITFSFSAYLLEAGWTKLDDAKVLKPGDIVFTSGYPDHVFVFHSWSKKGKQLAKVIDNKGLLTKRRMVPVRGSHHSPFAYALRGP